MQSEDWNMIEAANANVKWRVVKAQFGGGETAISSRGQYAVRRRIPAATWRLWFQPDEEVGWHVLGDFGTIEAAKDQAARHDIKAK
jgi:hypothetical protein